MKRILTALVLIPLVVWLILWAPVWAFIAALVVVGLFALREGVQIGNNRVIPALACLMYIGGAWLCAYALRAVNPHWLLFAFLLCWAGDTAALYVGRISAATNSPRKSARARRGRAPSDRSRAACLPERSMRTT